MAADRTPIKCWGSFKLTLQAAGNHFSWNFLLAAGAFPILGADFLEHFAVWVDLRRRRLYGLGRHPVPLAAPVPVAASDVEKTTIVTPFGLFEFLRMPFGLRNAGQSF